MLVSNTSLPIDNHIQAFDTILHMSGSDIWLTKTVSESKSLRKHDSDLCRTQMAIPIAQTDRL